MSPETRPRVAHIIDELPAHGAERLLVDVLMHRSDAFDYHVVCLMRGGALEDEIRAMGLPLSVLGYRGKHDFSLLWRLARWLRRHRVAVVHTHLFTADTWGRVAARLAGIRPLFCTVHSTNGWKPRFYRWVDRVLARVTTRVIACSEEVGAVLVESDRLPPARVAVVRNGVAMKRFESISGAGVREEFGIPTGVPLLAVVGRFHAAKGHHDMVQALARLHERGLAWHCLFVGEGELRDEVETDVRRSGLASAITFTGQRADIPRILAALDVLVLPSRWEGLPMILLEGMAMARAVVATRVGGIPDVVRHGVDGLLVPLDDVAALERALREVIGDSALRARLGGAAQDTIHQRYSVAETAAAYEAMYRQALGLVAPDRIAVEVAR